MFLGGLRYLSPLVEHLHQPLYINSVRTVGIPCTNQIHTSDINSLPIAARDLHQFLHRPWLQFAINRTLIQLVASTASTQENKTL